MLTQKPNQGVPVITTRQKVAVAFLLFSTFTVIGLGAYGMKKNLTQPFAVKGEAKYISDLEDAASSSVTSLQQKDTDKDGLNDFDELNSYGTSPYLPDTDSDGLSDGDELRKGSNPVCAEGKNCANGNALTNADWGAATTTTLENGQKVVFSEEQVKQMEIVAGLAQARNDIAVASTTVRSAVTSAVKGDESSAILQGKASATELRAALVKSGIPKAQLDQLTDEVLLKNYRDMLNKQTQ